MISSGRWLCTLEVLLLFKNLLKGLKLPFRRRSTPD
jgi:hypothetical protein